MQSNFTFLFFRFFFLFVKQKTKSLVEIVNIYADFKWFTSVSTILLPLLQNSQFYQKYRPEQTIVTKNTSTPQIPVLRKY